MVVEKYYKLTLKEDKQLELFDIHNQITQYMSLLQAVEFFYKNTYVYIIELKIEGTPTSKERYLLDLIQNKPDVHDCDYRIFEACITIPYRAINENKFREKQLERFIYNMNQFLRMHYPYLNYKFIILEQHNDLPFNRGRLLNAGFLEHEKRCDDKSKDDVVRYYIHHNCDIYPQIDFKPTLDYSFTPIYEVRDLYGYFAGIGGIAIFNRLSFLKTNGFPNNFFYWGAEDLSFFKRCITSDLIIVRDTYNVGIIDEPHERDVSHNSENLEKILYDNPSTNGLNTCVYSCTLNENSIFKDPNVVHYLIDFEYDS